MDGVVPLQKHHVLGELKQISLQINFISNVKRETGAQRVGEGKGKRKVGKERRRGGRDREERRGKGGNKEVGGRSRERRKE